MEGMGLKSTPVAMRCLLGPLVILGLWQILLGLTNSPNGGYNPPPAAYPTLTPTPPPFPYTRYL